jgi:hypothetical protein
MDSTTRDAMRRLARERAGVAALPAAAAPAPIARVSSLSGNAVAATGTAGIASPLTEDDYTLRTWHTAESMVSSDGVFTFYYTPLASLTLADANGAPVVINLAAPPT